MSKKNVILVVDDEAEIRLLLKEFLEGQDFDVCLAADGQQAIALAEKQKPDLVITDLLLPKEHGIDVLHTIKERFFIPVIAISGIYEKNEILAEVADIHLDGFYKKPLHLQDLLKGIQAILNG